MQRQMQTASDEGGRCVQAGGRQAGRQREMRMERARGGRSEKQRSENQKQRPEIQRPEAAAKQPGQTDRQTAKQPEGLHGEGLGG
jgi:hypothetical protein